MSVTSRAHATRLTTPRRAWPKTRARTPLPDDLPLFQVSVPAEITLALGRALRSLHDRGIGIMLGGQPVHGPDVATAHLRSRLPEPQMGLAAISRAILPFGHGVPKDRDERVLDLMNHPAYKQAHPMDEHFLRE
ncbi:hypothetical protein OC842_003943 [Tilletia horrida]|uniref:Uncharacterized protein n=1 Tax=Tilletia horrida TaxID=155126 RepID=A0AAN6GAK7_9BASI|nr:hypothetical protein OC842_003943 [Tilletia horrida]